MPHPPAARLPTYRACFTAAALAALATLILTTLLATLLLMLASAVRPGLHLPPAPALAWLGTALAAIAVLVASPRVARHAGHPAALGLALGGLLGALPWPILDVIAVGVLLAVATLMSARCPPVGRSTP